MKKKNKTPPKSKKPKPAPSGFKYDDVSDTIEEIANNKSKQYGKISYFDPEDIKQEVRIKCWSVLKHYDKKRAGANLKTFLTVCADNRLRDIKRSVLYKFNSPCTKCEFHKQEGDKCVKFANKIDCCQHAKHERYIQAKLSNSHPIDIDTQRIYDNNSNSFVENLEFIDFVETHLPSGFMPLFRKLQDVKYNFKSLKFKERIAIQTVLYDIFVEFGGFDYE